MRKIFLLALLLVLAGALPVQATTYYVDAVNGNNANTGLSVAQAWQTLNKATGQDATFTPSPGDTFYILNGTYNGGQVGDTAAFRPTVSGTSSNPIAYRAYTPPTGARHRPLVTRTLDNTDGDSNAGIGDNGQTDIIWDGIILDPPAGVLVIGTRTTIENCEMDARTRVGGVNGNKNPMYLSGSVNATIRNNKIGGATTNTGTTNHGSLFMISTSGAQVNNNEFYGGAVFVNMKRSNTSFTVEKNWMHDSTDGSIEIGSAAGSTEGPGTYRYNVIYTPAALSDFYFVRMNVDITDPTITFDGHVFHNNSLYTPGSGNRGAGWTRKATTSKFYNNIVVVPATIDFTYLSATPAIPAATIDYNDYFGTSGTYSNFRTDEFGADLTLAQWQATNPPSPDAHAITTDPLFMGPLSGTVTVNSFKLQGSSPCINAGRTGGTPAGSAVNMGAFLTNSDVIGIPPASAGATAIGRVKPIPKRRR